MKNQYEEIEREIIRTIREEIGWEDNGCVLDTGTRLIEDLEMDSFMIVELIVLIEEQFHVELSDSMELLEHLETIGSLTEWVGGKV